MMDFSSSPMSLLENISAKMNPHHPVMKLFDPDITGNTEIPLPSATVLSSSSSSPSILNTTTKASSHRGHEGQDLYFTLVVVSLSIAVFAIIFYFLNKFLKYLRRTYFDTTSPPTDSSGLVLSSPPPKSSNRFNDEPPQYDGPPPYEVAIRMSAIEDSSVGSLSKYVSSSIIV